MLAACADLGRGLKLTRAAVGSGMIGDEDPAKMHGLIHYEAEAAIADRRHEEDRLFLTVRYSNRDHPETGMFTLSEFMVWAEDPETGQETDFLYATLGDFRQPVPACSENFPAGVWSYPLVLTVSGELQVNITASPGLATWDDLLDIRMALSGKADKSVQETVEQTAPSSRTVHLEAAELQAFLDSLPRLLTERLTVKVSGEVTGGLTIRDFYGPGYIFFPNENLQIHGELLVASCSVMVHIKHVSVTATEDMGLNSDLISVSDSRHVYLQDVTMSGYGDMRNTIGVVARNCSAVKVADCRFTGLQGAAMATGSSLCTINDSTGENNNIGASVYVGGVIFLHGTTPATVGGAANSKQSGLIVDKNGNLI